MTKVVFFFSKNSHRYLDLEPNNLNVEVVRDIMIPNKCVKYLNSLINAGARAMTKFFVVFFLFCFFFLFFYK